MPKNYAKEGRQLTRRKFIEYTSTGFVIAAVGGVALADSDQNQSKLLSPNPNNLDNGDAQWIGYNPIFPRRLPTDGAESRLDWKGVSWVWTNEETANGNGATGQRFFRWTCILPADMDVESAWFQFTADDSASLFVNGQKRSECRTWEKPVEREISDNLLRGKNVFGIQAINAGGPAGWAIKLSVQLKDGDILEMAPKAGDLIWTDSLYSDAKWAAPEYEANDWHPASVLGEMGMVPWGKVQPAGFMPGSNQSAPAPLLRRSFKVLKPLKGATLLSSGLGCHEVYFNGLKLDENVLDPAMTQYDKTVLYVRRDVARFIKPSENVIGVMLGHGWFGETANTTWNFDQAAWHDRPKLLLNLRLEYEDGTSETIVSDTAWKAAASPVLMDDIMNGEVYDASAEQPGWASITFDDSKWDPAEVMSAPGGVLRLQTIAPMRVMQTIAPVKMWQARQGVFIFDFGQNIAGWVRIRVRGSAGQEIYLRYGEQLQNERIDRTLGALIWSGWFQEDRYLLKGSGIEEWEPRFTYHGFRYVEVQGWPGSPGLSDLDGRVVHTSFTAAGSFECSNPILNAIQHNVLWSYRGNFHGFPTDCPTREKKGWTGDAHLACEQAMYNWDNQAGYEKWLQDFSDIQDSRGRLKTVIPSPGWGGDATDWDVAALLIPWYVYVYTGNLEIVESAYPMMKKWAAYHAQQAKDFIQYNGVSDWNPAKTRTPTEITSTCYYYGGITRLAKMASALGKFEDADAYRKEANAICGSFGKHFVKPDGTVGEGSQAAQACALYYGLIQPGLQLAAARKLSEAFTKSGDHVDVGVLGSKAILRVLSEYGYHEQAYRVVTQKTAPGYGWMLQQGCTCLTEDWYGGGSQNHVMFGDVSAWFYKYLAGIQPDSENPGFAHFFLRPLPTGDLKWVKAEYHSRFGLIRSQWEKKDDASGTAQFTVPLGTKATIILPDGQRKEAGPGEVTYTWKLGKTS